MSDHTNDRRIYPEPVKITTKENSELSKYPTKIVVIFLFIIFGIALLLYFAIWRVPPVSYEWDEILDMADKDDSLKAIREQNDDNGFNICDERRKDENGRAYSYGTTEYGKGYIATGKFYEGKYPEIYLNESKTRVAFIAADESIGKDNHLYYLNMERPVPVEQ